MIRNQYNYLTPSVKDTKGKEGRKQRYHNQNTTSRTPKGQFLSPKKDQTAIQITIYQYKYANTYNDRNSKPQQKHRFGTVSKKPYRGA